MSRVIMPAPGEFAAVVSVLLDLADRPRDVATTTDFERLAVVIPDELYERFQVYQSLSASPDPAPKKKASRK